MSEWNPLITSEAQSQPSYGSAGFKTCNLKSYKVCRKIKTKKEKFSLQCDQSIFVIQKLAQSPLQKLTSKGGSFNIMVIFLRSPINNVATVVELGLGLKNISSLF